MSQQIETTRVTRTQNWEKKTTRPAKDPKKHFSQKHFFEIGDDETYIDADDLSEIQHEQYEKDKKEMEKKQFEEELKEVVRKKELFGKVYNEQMIFKWEGFFNGSYKLNSYVVAAKSANEAVKKIMNKYKEHMKITSAADSTAEEKYLLDKMEKELRNHDPIIEKIDDFIIYI